MVHLNVKKPPGIFDKFLNFNPRVLIKDRIKKTLWSTGELLPIQFTA